MLRAHHINRAGACRPGPARSAFTLIEVLAAMLLIGIVMPVVMQGITAATRAGSGARHRTEAATLADAKLAELTATNAWDGGTLSGDFGSDWPTYSWQATVAPWAGDVNAVGLQQLDVKVSWHDAGQTPSVTVTSLVYVRPIPAS